MSNLPSQQVPSGTSDARLTRPKQGDVLLRAEQLSRRLTAALGEAEALCDAIHDLDAGECTLGDKCDYRGQCDNCALRDIRYDAVGMSYAIGMFRQCLDSVTVQNGEAEALLKARLAEWQDDDDEDVDTGNICDNPVPPEEQVDLADIAAVVTDTWRDKPALL